MQPCGDGFTTEAVDGPLLLSAGLGSLFSDLTWGQQRLFISHRELGCGRGPSGAALMGVCFLVCGAEQIRRQESRRGLFGKRTRISKRREG